jgi:hypothetical protein
MNYYKVHTITDLEQLEECEKFCIDHYQWIDGEKPEVYGRMGLLEGYGLVILMTAAERNPIKTFTKDNDPVYEDSAMEAFLNFSAESTGQSYLNFEMNANGAMLSQFGTSKERELITYDKERKAVCEVSLKEDSWSVLLKIPMGLIEGFFGREPLQSGDSFTCNFYKVCQKPGQEHYGSFAPINSEKPNFHLPEFFQRAVII